MKTLKFEIDKKQKQKNEFSFHASPSETKKLDIAYQKMLNKNTFVKGLCEFLEIYNLNPEESLEAALTACIKEIEPRAEYRYSNIINKIDDLTDAYGLTDDYGVWSKKISSLLSKFSKSDIKQFIFELTQDIREYTNRLSDSNTTEFSRLVIGLLGKLNGGFEFYDVGCGNGSYLLELCKHLKAQRIIPKSIFGVDINKKSTEIATMLIKALYPDFYTEISCFDIFDDKKHLRPAQKVFCLPPLGFKRATYTIRKSKVVNFEFTHKNSAELEFLDLSISCLRGNNLKAVVLVPSKVLYNEVDRTYINELIKEGWIEGIIELPPAALKYVSARTSLLVLSPNNKKVKLFDSNRVCKKFTGNYKNFILPYKEILDDYKIAEEMPTKKLIDSPNLLPSNLLLSEKVKFEGTKLSDIADVITGNKNTMSYFEHLKSDEPTSWAILQSSDIVEDSVNWDGITYLKDIDASWEKYCLQKDDIVITSKSSKFKICHIDKKPLKDVIVTGGMIIVRCNKQKVNPMFVYMYLMSEKGRMALKLTQTGTTIISTTAAKVATILIPNVKLSEQNELAFDYEFKRQHYLSLKEQVEKARQSLYSFTNSYRKEK